MTGIRETELLPKRPVDLTGRRAQIAGIGTVVAILALLPAGVGDSYAIHILILTFIYLVAAMSFRAISISGQFSIAHGAFMGIGAYAAGMASRWLNAPAWLTLPLGACVSMVIGMLLSYPFSRLRAIYYAMGSLFFGVVIVNVVSVGGEWTGAYTGLTGIHPIFSSRISYYYLFLGLALFSVVALYRFEFSRIGWTCKAVAQSYMVAASVGIDESGYRMLSVGVGSFFVGLVGAAYAHYNMVISPSSFNLGATLWICIYVLVGGIYSFAGPIIGTAVLVIIPESFRGLKMYAPYVSAAILVIIVYLMPDGLAGLPRLVRSRMLRHDEKEEAGPAA